MNDLTILNTEDLPLEQELSTCFLDLAAAVRTQAKDCVTINQFAWRVINSVPSQYCPIFSLCVVPIFKIASKVGKQDIAETEDFTS